MKRHDFITFVGGAAIASPLQLYAQRAETSYRIAYLALACFVLLVVQAASAPSDPQSPADSANDACGTDFRYGAD